MSDFEGSFFSDFCKTWKNCLASISMDLMDYLSNFG